MSKNYNLIELNTENENDVISYEKSLYKAFSNSYMKNIDLIWKIDHKTRRTSTVVPYNSQTILTIKLNDSNKFLAAAGINYSTDQMQMKQIGFKINKSGFKICEVLYMFSLMDYMGGIPVMQVLSEYLLKTIVNKGIQYLYATCSQRKLRAYISVGFNNIDKIVFGGEEEYLLEYEVKENALRKG